MNTMRVFTVAIVCVLLSPFVLRGQESGSKGPNAADPSRPIRLYLMEGSVVSGELSVEAITVETEFGTLTVPVSHIVSFTPGLDSHPQERQRIGLLIQQLGSNNAKERETAQKALLEMGPPIRAELERHAADQDAERRSRVQQLLQEMDELQEGQEYSSGEFPPLVAQDRVETTLFTALGRIAPQEFQVKTRFGPLTVSLKDIRRGLRENPGKPELRKTVRVTGANLAQSNFLNTGIRVSRGDELSLTADGSITMTPWGNNMSSTPDGSENFNWFVPNEIPGGALVGRIGTQGPVFKVGSKHSLESNRSGDLHLGVGMDPQFALQGYTFPGEYNVRVRVNSKPAQ